MTHDLGANLDQLFAQSGQRPVLNVFRQRQRPHEVAEIVGQGVKLQPDGVVAELATRHPPPMLAPSFLLCGSSLKHHRLQDEEFKSAR